MKVVSYSAKISIFAALAAIIFISSLPVHGQSIRPAADGQFNLLVAVVNWIESLKDFQWVVLRCLINSLFTKAILVPFIYIRIVGVGC